MAQRDLEHGVLPARHNPGGHRHAGGAGPDQLHDCQAAENQP